MNTVTMGGLGEDPNASSSEEGAALATACGINLAHDIFSDDKENLTKFNEKVCEVETLRNSVSSLQRVSTILHLQKRSHDQNMAISLLEITSGFCFAVARSWKSSLGENTHTHHTSLEQWKCQDSYIHIAHAVTTKHFLLIAVCFSFIFSLQASTLEAVQKNLQEIWTRLHVPTHQQIDMAIKYSGDISQTQLHKVVLL